VITTLAQGTIRLGPFRACHERGPEGAESNGGGGGIRTRVRKYLPAGIYDAYPLLKCRSRRGEAAKNRRKPTPENLIADV
jgi:hypothetical protein